MDATSSFGILKFITIALYIAVLSGLLITLGKATVTLINTGEYKPVIEATLGQVLNWDNKIYEATTLLKDDTVMSSVPEGFKQDFKDFAIKQIIMYLMLFIITGYLLFRFGNWLAGEAAFNASTDIIIIFIIVVVFFPLAELTYGWLMNGQTTMPYHGIVELFKGDTWNTIFGMTSNNVDAINNTINRTVINVGG